MREAWSKHIVKRGERSETCGGKGKGSGGHASDLQRTWVSTCRHPAHEREPLTSRATRVGLEPHIPNVAPARSPRWHTTPMQTHSAVQYNCRQLLVRDPNGQKHLWRKRQCHNPQQRGDMSRRPPVAGVGPTVVAGAPAPIELYDHVVSAYAYAPAAHDTHSIASFDSDDGGVGNGDAWQTQSHHTPAGHTRGGVSGGGGDHRSGAGPAVLPRGWADSVANYTPGEHRVVTAILSSALKQWFAGPIAASSHSTLLHTPTLSLPTRSHSRACVRPSYGAERPQRWPEAERATTQPRDLAAALGVSIKAKLMKL